MKNIISIIALVFAVGFTSLQKSENGLTDLKKSQFVTTGADKCQGDPPEWCARVRCSGEGKPVCGCNGVTYANECQAQCDGVVAYTFGPCESGGGKALVKGQ